VRATNQDSYAIIPLNDHALLCVVADGMGGHKGGEVASQLATTSFAKAFEGLAINPKGIPERLERGMRAANDLIHVRSLTEPNELFGMGTTCVVVLAVDGLIHWVHVGDSRIYCHRLGHLQQLTRDHSRVQELIDAGIISQAEARVHPERNVITQALGIPLPLEVDHSDPPRDLKPGERILLCTDGLTGMLDDSGIGAILDREAEGGAAVTALIQAALDAGGTDNITAVLVQHAAPSETASA
jgi:protein phosphatase